MTSPAFWHLAWKEYRVNRAYWLSLVVLVVMCETLIAVGMHSLHNVAAIYFAIGVPAFFAIGSAGTAFAMEREEGTLEFLRAAAVSPTQLVASKLTVTLLATVALYLVLWPISLYFSGGRLPESALLGQAMSFWLITALEAIAWGTFFSLLSARPLLAICQAVFVVVLIALLLIIYYAEFRSPDPSSAAAPWRILIALVVLAVDIFLGLEWLDRDQDETWLQTIVRQTARGIIPDPVRDSAEKFHLASEQTAGAVAARLLGRDRSAALGRLLWQQWRQSAWMMALFGGALVALAIAARLCSGWTRFELTSLSLPLAALMGCFVFRADQERQGYRFFAEHNVPPRYVWLTRQLPWLVTLLVVETIRCVWLREPPIQFHDLARLLPIMMMLSVVGFSVGQWASMFIRSPILAAVFAVASSIAILEWFDLIGSMYIGFVWWLAPIAVVLFAATWLRAPDWVIENRSWKARGRAAAMVLLPAAALLVALPVYRVYQIPGVSPGFDVATSAAPISSEAEQTAHLYLRASQLFVPYDAGSFDTWLAENDQAVKLAVEASRRPSAELFDPRTAEAREPPHAKVLAELVFASANQLRKKGNLDESLDRYFAALKIACERDACNAPTDDFYLSGLPEWASQKGQTAERVDAALQRLRKIDSSALRLQQKVEWYYVFARHRLLADDGVIFSDPNFHIRFGATDRDITWAGLMPWERTRALRMLDLLTATALARLRAMNQALTDRRGVADFAPLGPTDFFKIKVHNFTSEEDQKADEEQTWLETTRPSDLLQIGYIGLSKAWELADFELWRRATMIQLAIQSYRLKHGSLPKSLDDLVGPYFHELPLDPYSGLEFEYYPAGIPESVRSDLVREGRDIAQLAAAAPGIWSVGADRYNQSAVADHRETWTPEFPRERQVNSVQVGPLTSHETWTPEFLREHQTPSWHQGVWFPIPEQQY